MFGFFTSIISSCIDQLQRKLRSIFAKPQIDEQSLEELRTTLLQADVGCSTTNKLLAQVQEFLTRGELVTGEQLQQSLITATRAMLARRYQGDSSVILMVGINGAGKTTMAAKLAAKYQAAGQKVLLVAADTFRAAAVDQLSVWAEKIGCEIVAAAQGSDPASVVYRGMERFVQGNFDRIIIDTAGRLQTKTHLMAELNKVHKVIAKLAPTQEVTTLLTIDATLGQNSLQQATLFHQATSVSGLVLTKMDSQAKGGIILAIADQLNLPVAYISNGQKLADFTSFESDQFINALLL